MNTEGDEGDDGDYGFGGFSPGPSPEKIRLMDTVEERYREHYRRLKEQQNKAEAEFNSYMIQLFNERSKQGN